MSESAQIAVPELPQRPERPQPLNIARQYWKILFAGALCGLLLGVAYAVTRPKTYTCRTTLLFPSAAPASSGLAALAGGGGGDPSLPLLQGALSSPQVGSNADTATLMVQSRTLEKQVIHQLKLWDKWDLQDYGKVTQRFENSLKCSTGKSGELDISFKDPSAELSYQITQEILKELKQLTLDMRLDPAADNVRFLERKVGESRKKLVAAQKEFSTYQKQYRILDLPSQSSNLAQRYADLQKEAASAEMEAQIAARQAAMLSSSAKQQVTASIAPSSAGDTLGPLYQKVKEAESQLALLKYQLTDNHPQVQEQKRVLQQARELLQSETKRQLKAVQSGVTPGLNTAVLQASASRARAAGLKQSLANLAKEIDKLPNRASGFLELQAKVQANTQALTLYQQELEKAKILAQSRGPVLIELDPPELPFEPDKIRRVVMVIAGLLLGFGLAALLPYMEWQRRNEIYEIYEDNRFAFEDARLISASGEARALQSNKAESS